MNSEWQICYGFSGLVTTAIAILFGAWLLLKKKSQPHLPKGRSNEGLRPEKWVLVGKVSKLIVYPIKSCLGVEVNEAEITKEGLKFCGYNIRDRDFMVVDKSGKSQTMMQFPSMAFISLELGKEKDFLIMSAPGMDEITFTYPNPQTSEEHYCRVKHDKVKALDCGDKVAEWLETFIGKEGLRLYYHDIKGSQRTFEPYHFDCPQFEQSDMGTFHNETAFLLTSQESIDELNDIAVTQSSWKNWRPTILIDNVAEPFAEVNWSFVRIGHKNAIFKHAVACYRCPITTIDPETAVLPKDGEPLKTLRGMKKADMIADKKVAEMLKNKGIMGVRLGLFLPAGEGAIVKVGDKVYAALL